MSFDALAPHYRWLEFILAGHKLQACRTAYLHELAHCRKVLILGEGNGRFLAACRQNLESAEITCVDASSRMLQLARKRLVPERAHCRNVEFIHADALEWNAPRRSYDLIVTHFFLDCFRKEELERLVAKLAQAAAASADWLLADFQIPPQGWRRVRAQAIHWMMYLFFRCVTRLPAKTLTNPDPFLAANGFVLHQRRVSEWGLLHTDRWTRGSLQRLEARGVNRDGT